VWEWQNPLPQGNSLSDIAFFDANTGVAVGSYGTILRTTDGGVTWEVRSSGMTTNLYAVATTDGGIGVAVGESGIILQTTDGGATWASRSSGVVVRLSDVAFAAAREGIGSDTFANGPIAIAVGWYRDHSGVVLRSTDGGQSWTAQESGVKWLNAVSFADANVGTIVSGDNTMLRTADGGATWERQTIDYWSRIFFHDVQYVDPDKGFALGSHQSGGLFLATTDAGVTWGRLQRGMHLLENPQRGWDGPSIHSISKGNAETIIMVGSSGDGLRTTDGGVSWQWEKPFPRSYALYGVAFATPATATAVGRGGMITRTSDGGETWSDYTRGAVANLWGVSFTDASHGIAVGEHDTVVRTADGGNSWVRQTVTTGPPAPGFSDVFAIDINTVVAVGYWGIWRTGDGGASWAKVWSEDDLGLVAVAFGGANVGVAVGESRTVLQTLDNGRTWARISVSGETDDYLWDISFGSATTAMAVGANGMILRTTDGGITWQYPSRTEDHLTGVSLVDDNIGTVVGPDGTILRTTNGGTTWINQSTGTDDFFLGVAFLDASSGIVVGNGGRVFRTDDGGVTWTLEETGTRNDLTGVSFIDANAATIVGASGTILRAITGER